MQGAGNNGCKSKGLSKQWKRKGREDKDENNGEMGERERRKGQRERGVRGKEKREIKVREKVHRRENGGMKGKLAGVGVQLKKKKKERDYLLAHQSIPLQSYGYHLLLPLVL